jgi:predicted permease
MMDLKIAVRGLLRDFGFAGVAILTLGLGIGVNTAIFTWINGLLLHPVPGAEKPEQLIEVVATKRHGSFYTAFSYPNYAQLSETRTGVEGLAAYAMDRLTVTVDGTPTRMWSLLVSDNYFSVVEAPAILGRTFENVSDPALRSSSAVISYNLWMSQYGGSASAIGKSLALNGRSFTIIGVANRGFRGTYNGMKFDLWLPLTAKKDLSPETPWLASRNTGWLNVIGRLKAGAAPEQTRMALRLRLDQILLDTPNTNLEGIAVFRLWKSPMQITVILGPVLIIVMGISGLILLLACANLANLMSVRFAGRQRETALRIALGAGRFAVVRLCMIESLILAFLGGSLAVLLGWYASHLLARLTPLTRFPLALDPQMDWGVLAVNFGLAGATSLIFGLLPGLTLIRRDLAATLRNETAAGSASPRRSRGLSALVVFQVSLCMLLLIPATLMLRSTQRALRHNPGFDADGIAMASVDLSGSGLDAVAARKLCQRLLHDLNRYPGIGSASLASSVPLGFGSDTVSFVPSDYQKHAGENLFAASASVAPGYFRTLRTPLLQGRDFIEEDQTGQADVAIVNRSFANRYWPNQSALGKQLIIANRPISIVGVSGDINVGGLKEAPEPFVFLPLLDHYVPLFTIVVRTEREPAALLEPIEKLIHQENAGIAVFDQHTMKEHVATAAFQFSILGFLLGVLGILGAVIAAAGVFGVASHIAEMRVRDLAIRVALGADRERLLSVVLWRSLRVTAIGLVIGAGCGLALSSSIASFLFDVSPGDLPSYTIVSVLVFTVAFIASSIPGIRTLKLDVAHLLRS